MMKETVICIHGMGRTRFSMAPMACFFKKQGYHTVNKSYKSRSNTVDEVSTAYFKSLIPPLSNNGELGGKVHFITHSLGGILLRQYLQHHKLPEGSRIIMLAPPNRGSHVTDKYQKSAWYKLALGTKSAQQLSSREDSLVRQLKAITHEVGIIAGNKSADPWFNHCFPGEHDGKVAVSHTTLDEMTDFLVAPTNHTFLMRDPAIQQQCLHFIKHGIFKH